MENPTNAELKELREEVLENHPTPKDTKKKLIFDGRQYSLRLPKKYVEEAGINKDKDEFLIRLEMPKPSSLEKPKLLIELLRHEK